MAHGYRQFSLSEITDFKLCDIVALLNGTGLRFSVGYDNAAKAIAVKTGEPYAAVGGELLITDEDKSASTIVSAQKAAVNGSAVELVAYNIGGNNLFMLRVGMALGFDIACDVSTQVMIITSK